MAEEEEIMMDDTSIAIDDVAEEGGQDETKSYNIIPFIMDRYKKPMIKGNKKNREG